MLQSNLNDVTMARVQHNLDNSALELSRFFANAHKERCAKNGFEVKVETPNNPNEAIIANFRRISEREILHRFGKAGE